jgi:uncharacterized protein YjdB
VCFPISYASSNASVATISGNVITIVGAGTSTITATQAASGDYLDGSTTATLAVAKASQTLTLTVPTSAPLNTFTGSSVVAVSASSTSGLAVTVDKDGSSTAEATISGTAGNYTLTNVGSSGSVVIVATQAGNDNYNPATKTQSFDVLIGNQQITFGELTARNAGDAPFTLSATGGGSENAVTFVSGNTAVATISGNTVTIVGPGKAKITASQAGNSSWNAAPDVVQTLTVNAIATVLTLDAISKTFGDGDFTVAATSNSGGTIVYTSSNTSVATISGNTVTIVGAGTSAITAAQAESGNYNASQTTATLTVKNATGNLMLSDINKTFGDADFTLEASSSSQGALTYSSSNTSVATVSGSTVTIVGAGTSTITASQAGSGNYGSETTSAKLSVAMAAQTLTLDVATSASLGAVSGSNTLTIKTTSSLSLPVTVTISTGASTATGTLTATENAGEYTLSNVNHAGHIVFNATQAGSANQNEASLSKSLEVTMATQEITFEALTGKTYGDVPFTVSATGGASGHAVTFTSSDPAVATCSGTNGATVTITGSGSCQITASQAGVDNAWGEAAPVKRTLSVGTKALSIAAAAAQDKPWDGNAEATLTGTLSGVITGDQVTLTLSGSFAGSASGDNIAVTSTSTIGGAGAGNYTLTQPTGLTASITKLSQSITFDALPQKTYGDAAFPLWARGGASGHAVTFTSSDPTIATCTGSDGATITILKAGTCEILANQAGSSKYGSATQVSRTLTIARAGQTISLTALLPEGSGNVALKDFGSAIQVTATSTSGLSVSIALAPGSAATLNGSNELESIGATGTITINLTQAGNENYNPATLSQSFDVVKSNQRITFGDLAEVSYGAADYDAAATASSSLAVTYASSDESVATIVGGKIHLTGAGRAIITAEQTGNQSYNGAVKVSRTLIVNPRQVTIASAAAQNKTYDGTTAATLTGTLSGVINGDEVSLKLSGEFERAEVSTEIAVSSTSALGGAGAENYTLVQPTGLRASISGSDQVITFAGLPQMTYGDSDTAPGATSTSALEITYTSSNTSVAIMVDGRIHVTGVGTTDITASQSGNSTYGAAEKVVQLLSVKAGALIITSAAAQDKTWDGTTRATLTGTLSGVVTGDEVTLALEGKFISADAGNNIAVSSTSTISGTKAGNYTLTQPRGLTANITKIAQSITFEALEGRTYGDAPFTVSATGGASGSAVSFTSSDPAVATCTGTDGATITILKAGSCEIYANQEGSSTYAAAAQVSRSLSIARADQVIELGALPVGAVALKDFGSAIQVTATATSGLAVNITLGAGSAATLNGSKQLTNVGSAGTIVINLDVEGNGNYNPGSGSYSFDVVKSNQRITFADLEEKTYGAQDYAPGATASSTLAVTYASSDATVATIVGGKIHLTGAGRTTITATQNGDDAYNPANKVTNTLSVHPKAVTIASAAAQNKAYDGTTGATLSGTLSGVINEDAVSLTLRGSFESAAVGNAIAVSSTSQLSGAGAESYILTQPSGLSADITKAGQSITFEALSSRTYGDADFDGGATSATSQVNAITYASSNAAVATIVEGKIHVVGIGTATITASQGGSSNYAAAADAEAVLTVTAKALTVSWVMARDKMYDGTTGATLSGTLSGVINGDDVRLTLRGSFERAGAGDNLAVIPEGSISGAGAANYTLRLPQGLSANIRKAGQSITFGDLQRAILGDADIAPGATASSGLAVTYSSSDESVATIVDGRIHLLAQGSSTITASQAGEGNYLQAEVVTRLLWVIDCINPQSGGLVEGSQEICSGSTPSALTSTEAASLYRGVLQYKWQSSTTGAEEGFQDIAASNSATYAAGALTATTWYRRLSRVECREDWAGAAVSNVIRITVDPATVGGTIQGSATVCPGSSTTTLTLRGQTGSIVKWQKSTDNWSTATDVENTTTTLVAEDLTATTGYRAVVRSGVCPVVNSAAATVRVNPQGQVNQPDGQVISSGAATAAVTFATTNTGGETTYTWTNSKSSIGLAASGSGNIASFTAVNTGTAPVTASIPSPPLTKS